MVIHENHLATHIIDDRVFEISNEPKPKAYTLLTNNTDDPNAQSIIRCSYGQSVGEFEDYQMITSYAFDSNFPTSMRQSVRDAFAQWNLASNDKFVFNEVSNNTFMSIQWYVSSTDNDLGVACFPHHAESGFHLGDWMTFNGHFFDPINGTHVADYGLNETKEGV